MDEIELKFLNIDVENIKKKFDEIGAKLKFDTHLESYPFVSEDFCGFNTSKKFLRVRKVDGDVWITYKDPKIDSKMTSRKEIEIKVDNYEKSITLLESLGFKKGKIFKKHRVHYELGDVHFELDTLENIPTYLEIETQTEEAMEKICLKLNLDISKGKKGTIVEIYPEKFNV